MNFSNTQPPPGYREVEHARWTWANPDCRRCGGTGLVWTNVWDRDVYEYGPLYREDNDCGCVWTPDQDTLAALDAQYRSWGNPDRARENWQGIAHGLGPRRPGGRYWCGYWRTGYTVVAIHYTFTDGDPASPMWSITVQWDDGRHGTHFTPWNWSLDGQQRPQADHPGAAPPPPELQADSEASGAPREPRRARRFWHRWRRAAQASTASTA